MENSNQVPFNVPYLSGGELLAIKDVIKRKKLSGNGYYTNKCQELFREKYGFAKCLLTTSCTDALEMTAILINIQPGDEVIMPSYTFVSTANAFVLRGAKIVFADSCENNPNIDSELIEGLITKKTKAIVVVHYAGTACNMNKIMEIAKKYGLYIIEDAAQSIDNYFINDDNNEIPIGSIGHFSCFSFHETKNINCGEGGMLVINDKKFNDRAEIVWEKGTNRSAFFRGEVDKYNWVDIGSSFLMSEINAAFLWSQLDKLELVQSKRQKLWYRYFELLKDIEIKSRGKIRVQKCPPYSKINGHIFYLVCDSLITRNYLISQCKLNNIQLVFHYTSLHKTPFFINQHDGRQLVQSDMYSDCLVRLPLYFDLELTMVDQISNTILTISDSEW